MNTMYTRNALDKLRNVIRSGGSLGKGLRSAFI
jgi:hypothetical protein